MVIDLINIRIDGSSTVKDPGNKCDDSDKISLDKSFENDVKIFEGSINEKKCRDEYTSDNKFKDDKFDLVSKSDAKSSKEGFKSSLGFGNKDCDIKWEDTSNDLRAISKTGEMGMIQTVASSVGTNSNVLGIQENVIPIPQNLHRVVDAILVSIPSLNKASTAQLKISEDILSKSHIVLTRDDMGLLVVKFDTLSADSARYFQQHFSGFVNHLERQLQEKFVVFVRCKGEVVSQDRQYEDNDAQERYHHPHHHEHE